VDFFFKSSTNTTQQLHLLKFFIAGAQIIFYKSQMKKLVYAHIFASVAAVNMVQKVFTHPHQNM